MPSLGSAAVVAVVALISPLMVRVARLPALLYARLADWRDEPVTGT